MRSQRSRSLNRTALAARPEGARSPRLPAASPPFELRVHRRYNPEGATEYNIVPGLIGTILTMTMVMMTAIAVTRERERGTMENLLAMPVRPFEVMLGKIVPFVVVGYVQVAVILLAGSGHVRRPGAGLAVAALARASCCSSPPTSPSASPSRPWPRTSCRRCR